MLSVCQSGLLAIVVVAAVAVARRRCPGPGAKNFSYPGKSTAAPLQTSLHHALVRFTASKHSNPPALFPSCAVARRVLSVAAAAAAAAAAVVAAAMSLNGLDDPVVGQAYQAALADAGGW